MTPHASSRGWVPSIRIDAAVGAASKARTGVTIVLEGSARYDEEGRHVLRRKRTEPSCAMTFVRVHVETLGGDEHDHLAATREQALGEAASDEPGGRP